MQIERFLIKNDDQFIIQQNQYDLRGPYHRDALLNSRLPFGPKRLRFDLCLDMLPADLSNQKILGVGSGDCAIETILAKRGAQVTAFDPIFKAIEYARKADNRLDLLTANAALIPFKPESFNFALMLETLEHIPDHQERASLLEINRILKNDGQLLLSVPTNNRPVAKKHYRHYSRERLTSLLLQSGFEIKQTVHYRELESQHRGLAGKADKGIMYLKDWVSRSANGSGTCICSEPESTGIIILAQKNLI